MAHNEKGEEVLDQTPVAIPLNFKRPQPLNERIAQITAAELRAWQAEQIGDETPEDADDFNTGEDELDYQTTPWQERPGEEDPFGLTREAEIRAGYVKENLSEIDKRIYAGKEKAAYYKNLNKKASSKKPKPKARESSEVEDLEDEN